MSSICWTRYETKSGTAMDLRRRTYLITFFLLLWGINLTVVALGLPFLLASKIVSAAGKRTSVQPVASS